MLQSDALQKSGWGHSDSLVSFIDQASCALGLLVKEEQIPGNCAPVKKKAEKEMP
jgi:hypothetical protein